MKGFLKDYFNYSKGEIRGILVLLVLIIIVFLIPGIITKYTKKSSIDFSAFENQLKQFDQELVPHEAKQVSELADNFYFDPNTLEADDLMRLGLSERQVKTLVNYRDAGGFFHKPEDMKKLYTLDDATYAKLKPHIKIVTSKRKYPPKPESLTSSKSTTFKSNEALKKEPVIIELNTADTSLLMQLRGIGPVLSGRIIAYRNLLGGYCLKEQLMEVYGLNRETFELIKDNVSIDSSAIQLININTASFNTLNKHPYISYAQTKSILKYRDLMGDFSSRESLIENHIVDSLTFKKIEAYLSLQ